jgi:hypothetical protein
MPCACVARTCGRIDRDQWHGHRIDAFQSSSGPANWPGQAAEKRVHPPRSRRVHAAFIPHLHRGYTAFSASLQRVHAAFSPVFRTELSSRSAIPIAGHRGPPHRSNESGVASGAGRSIDVAQFMPVINGAAAGRSRIPSMTTDRRLKGMQGIFWVSQRDSLNRTESAKSVGDALAVVVLHAIHDMKPRLCTRGVVANPRDVTGNRCHLRLTTSANPSVFSSRSQHATPYWRCSA